MELLYDPIAGACLAGHVASDARKELVACSARGEEKKRGTNSGNNFEEKHKLPEAALHMYNTHMHFD